MEPIEDTDPHSCEHCGHHGQIKHFRRAGKHGPNFVCPRCYFSSETYHLYLEDKITSSPSFENEFPGMASLRRRKLPRELFDEYSKIERRIQARRAAAERPASGGCMLLAFGMLATFITIYAR